MHLAYGEGRIDINCYDQKRCLSSKCTTNRLAAGLRLDTLGELTAFPIFLAGLRICGSGKEEGKGKLEREEETERLGEKGEHSKGK